MQVIDADGDRTTALEWFPNANVLLVASLDGRIRMWGTVDDARGLGLELLSLPAVHSSPAGPRKSLSSAQFQLVVDVRSLPRLPGAVPQWGGFGVCAYTALASQGEARSFYRYLLGKSGWSEVPVAAALGRLGLSERRLRADVAIDAGRCGQRQERADQSVLRRQL